MSIHGLAVFSTLLVAAIAGHAAIAQCSNPWSAENSVASTWGEVRAVHLWDRDGPGPLPAVWVFGGDFLGAGSIPASRVASYDPTTGTWSAFGAGVNGRVHAFATLPNGDLAVGGEFTTAGGVPTNRVAVWNGSTWSAMAGGLDATVFALAVLPGGTLVAGGQFTTPGAAGSRGIARWQGSTWGPLGAGLAQGVVRALAVQPNGDLLATGSALQLGASGPFEWVVRWDGASWAPLGAAAAPPPFFHVNYDLLVRASGDVVLVGDSVGTLVGGSGRLATWNGTAWAAMPGPGTTTFRAAELGSGDLVAIGSGGYQVQRWDGASWAPLGSGLTQGVVRTVLALPGDQLLVGGTLTSGPDIRNAAHWNGASWSAVGGGWSGSDARMTALSDGSFVVAMSIHPASYVGLRAGGAFTLLGSSNRAVLALATMPNGDVVAGGAFTFLGGVAAERVARWDGNSWSPLGTGIGTDPSDYVSALVVLPNGDLVAGGRFGVAGGAAASCVARWDGASWSALGAGLGPIRALAAMPDGGVVAGGAFSLVGSGGTLSNIASWNGTSWQALGSGLNQPVDDVAVRHDGTIAACGLFSLPGPFGSQVVGPALWTGSAWQSIGGLVVNGSIGSLLTAANGDLLVGGHFTTVNGASHAGVARWNGSTWSGFGAGAAGVDDLTLAPNGDVGVAGTIATAGGIASARFARLSTTCPATVATIGVGCSGVGGSPSLDATSLPWLGTIFRSRATGLPANALVVEVLGHVPVSVPLAAILPQGVAGCTLTTSPELLQLHVPNAGAVELALPLSSSIAFVGNTLYQQVVALSLDPSLQIVELTSSNSLELVKGWF